jgi:hypothetical protein
LANIQEAIRRLTIWATTPGVAESEEALKKLAAAQGGVAVASKVTEGATVSLDQKFAALERRYNTQIRAEQDYEKVKRLVNAAVAQNPALQDRANATLAQAAEKYGQVTGLQKAMTTASQSLNLQVASLASNLGLTGQVLSAFGPWGFAAAVGLGAVEAALSFVSDKSHELAVKAKEIKEGSEAIGFTTTQFQAVRSEMGKFGIDSETMTSGLSKFTAGFEELRQGQGSLLADVRRVNPALADQMQRTTDAATAFTLFGKAVSETDNIFQRNQLLKAGMGKGASIYGAFFETRPDVAALTSAFEAAGKGIDANLIKKLAQLQIDIDKTRNAANTVFASMFGTSTLQAELDFARGMLSIATYAKEFKFSDDFQKFINFLSHPATLTALGLLAAVPLVVAGPTVGTVALGVGGAGLIAGGAVGGVTRMGANDNARAVAAAKSPANFMSPANSYSTFQAGATPRTPQAELADAEKLIALLGSAATATEKYETAVKKLNIARDAGEIAGKNYDRALGALGLDKLIAQQSAYASALGASLPIEDLVYQKHLQLRKVQAEDPRITDAVIKNQERLTREQANGVAAVNSQIDSLTIQSKTYGMSAGAAAEFTAIETKRLENLRNGRPDDEAANAALRERAKVLGQTTQKSAEDAAQNQANFDKETVFLSDIDKQIAQLNFRLHGKDWQDYADSMLSNTTRMTAGLKEVNDLSRNAFSTFGTDIASGKSGVDALTNSLGTMAQALQKASLNRLYDGLKTGDPSKVFGNQQLNSAQGALGIASAGVSGYQSGSPLAGAFGGAMAGATFGPAGAVIGGIAGLIGGFLGKDSQAAQALQQAQIAWKNMSMQVVNFNAAAKGFNLGPLTNELQSLYSTSKQLQDAALKAKDASGAASAANLFNNAVDRIFTEFKNGTQTLTPLQTSIKAVRDEAAGLKDTLDEIGFKGRAGTIDAIVQQQIDALTKQFNATFISGLTARLNTATGQTFLNDAASLLVQHQQDLTQAAELNDPALLAQVATTFRAEAQKIVNDAGLVGDAFNDFMRQFPQLADVVTQATKEVGTSIADFRSGLTSRLNVATGSNFLNDAAALLQQHQQDLADAARFGNDPALMTQIATLFSAEAQKIVNGAGLVGDAFTAFTRQFPDLAGVVVEATADISDAQKQLQDSLNSSAKTIVDYVANLRAGTSSTDSPQNRFNSAQSLYNAKLVLAQSGDNATRSAAQATITQDFENYRQAARDMFGSGVAYQQILTNGISQLLNLPAVQQTTDPVVQAMRDVLTAINAGIATQATDATLIGTIKTAIDAGNAAQVATALSTYFNRIDTNTSQTIDLTEMQTALAGMASNSALVNMFTRLDTDNSGSISRLELIKAATQSTQTSTANTDANTGSTAGSTSTTAFNTLNATDLATGTNNLLEAQRQLLVAIQGLQNTATDQLSLIRVALNTTGVSVNVVLPSAAPSGIPGLAPGTTNVPIQNQMVAALNKIVWNTFVIANNTNYGPRAAESLNGTYALGGLITGPGTATSDSILIAASNREYMMPNSSVERFGVGFFDQLRQGILPSVFSNDNFRAGNVVDFSAARTFPVSPPSDNAQHFVTLAQTLVRAAAGISMTEMNFVKEENVKLRALVAELTAAVRGNKPAPARPNQKTGTNR